MIRNWILGTDKRVPRKAREARKSLKLNTVLIGPLSLKPNYTILKFLNGNIHGILTLVIFSAFLLKKSMFSPLSLTIGLTFFKVY